MSENSTEKFNQLKYDKLRKKFEDVRKKIFNYQTRNLPEDIDERKSRVTEYRGDLVGAYNGYVKYVGNFVPAFDPDSKERVNNKVASYKQDILKAFTILDLFVDLPNKLEEIDIDKVIDKSVVQNDSVETTQIFVRTGTPIASTSQSATNSTSATNSESTEQSKQVLNGQSTEDISSQLDKTLSQNFKESETLESTEVERDINNPDLVTFPQVPNGQSIPDPPAIIDNNDDLPDHLSEISDKGEPDDQPIINMALTMSDILNGIGEFSHQNQDDVRQFIANVDMINALAPNQGETVLAVVRARLTNAHKLGDISQQPWNEIKTLIQEKYRTQVSFETAQEKLLSIRQGKKESLEAYSDRVKKLLEALNGATTSTNVAVQTANRTMNESLAVRKFKQNIFDEKIRIMALSSDHTTLYEAVSHAIQKREQLSSSNIAKLETDAKPVKNQSNGNNTNNGKTGNKDPKGKREPCSHCGKPNHASDRCYALKREQSSSNNEVNSKTERFANRAREKNSNVATIATDDSSDEGESVNGMSNSFSVHDGKIQVRPYHLNY